MADNLVKSLPSDLQKLTGSRHWLRRVVAKTNRWKTKYVTLTTNAELHYREPTSHHVKSLILIPASARLATVHEQLLHSRSHIFVLTAISMAQNANPSADRNVIFFAARRSEYAAQWVNAVNHLSAARVALTHAPINPLFAPLMAAWGHVPRLPLSHVPQIARALNLKLSVDHFQNSARRYGKPVGAHISFEHFARVVLDLAKTEVIKSIFNIAAEDEPVLSLGQLTQLLQCSKQSAEELLKNYNSDTCTPEFLSGILYHPINSVIDPEKANARHDMTRPLNHYIISSSHNTYLQADQIKGDSRASMYRIVIQRGCRCVEIDMWDGDDGQPVVTHGHTMTSEIHLERVLNIIREHAFSHGNDYPLILSLENHLSKPQQVIAAKLICEILGDYLYRPDYPGMHVEELTSPEKLKRRVLLKAKTGHSICMNSRPAELSNMEDDDSEEPEDSPKAVRLREEDPSTSSSGSDKSGKSNSSASKITEEIAELVYIAGGNRKMLTGLWQAGVSGKDRFIANSCVSVNEKKILDVWKNKKLDVIRDYNSHGLTRVYPKGTRLDSSNYNPTLAHFIGCQLVALNWQRHDSGLAVNEARFLSNGGCGYILAESLREPETAEPCTLRLQILSAFLLPKPKGSINRDTVDPYCILRLYDESFEDEDDYSTVKFTSHTARSNGLAPMWQETALLTVRNRALAVIVLRIYDHDRTSDDDLIGYCAVPTALLREGYRCFPLTSKDGDPLTIPSSDLLPSILCNVMWD